MLLTAVEPAQYVRQHIVPIVNEFRKLQQPDGRVKANYEIADEWLDKLLPSVRHIYEILLMPEMAEAFEADIAEWRQNGLESIPYFDHSLKCFVPPAAQTFSFIIAPLVATNGPAPKGHFLECFLVLREEPVELEGVAAMLPHPKNGCQSCRLITGSTGIMMGNCIVFFPENIKTKEKVESQSFAMFFFNKFQLIYLTETFPRVMQLFGTGWVSDALSTESVYRARSVWGYLHDYYHHNGPRPFDTNLQVKLNFFVGILEEIKVDCQSVVAACELDVPFGREIAEYILFERMLRYPNQPDAKTNFDAGTGLFLFEWLIRNGTCFEVSEQGLRLSLEQCVKDIKRLVNEVEDIERIEDDEQFKTEAKRYVRQYLPEGIGKEKFAIPDMYARYIGHTFGEPKLLDFSQLPY
ncbi:DUF6421 family protein [Paenibacillus sp. UMB4589-SE434]|uniref:DUF6421 family protein n=1 Tax=Paenibacillus sp. UMB4589-SE434 TaxID=3046314 RepID=UPI00254DE898|nr:DUF6421 family protein [Paenibacillus sp. UMB4589-SE434]MDK8181868.1 DUF6421 family protein [Paenibacillus sp. UMB4589-SE434]